MLLNDHSVSAFTARLAAAPVALPPPVARRLFAHVHRAGAAARPDFRAVRGLSLASAAGLTGLDAHAGRLTIVDKRQSPADGFVKYLFRLHDDKVVEAVLIPLPAGPVDGDV